MPPTFAAYMTAKVGRVRPHSAERHLGPLSLPSHARMADDRSGRGARDTGGVTEGESAELARRVLRALSSGDVPGFTEMLHPEIEIRTARGVRRGAEAAEEWAQKGYEHLERRYAIDRLEVRGDDVLARVRTQYVWRDTGLVGDEEPTVIELRFHGGKLIKWAFQEDAKAPERPAPRTGA
jgi:ketosteroid isomerase-like protein